MTGDNDESVGGIPLVGAVREGIGGRTLVLLLTGVLAGYSLGVLGQDAVIVPVVGSIPGFLFGTVGLLVAIGVYHRVGRCENCNRAALRPWSDCGCTDDCGDSCSYDP